MNNLRLGYVTFTDTAVAGVVPFTLGQHYNVLEVDDGGWLLLRDDEGTTDWRIPRRFSPIKPYK